jgi:hypothetical protein
VQKTTCGREVVTFFRSPRALQDFLSREVSLSFAHRLYYAEGGRGMEGV